MESQTSPGTDKCINYDIRRGNPYRPIWNALRKLGATRIGMSSYVVKTTKTAQEVQQFLKQFVCPGDTLTVAEASSWAGKPG